MVRKAFGPLLLALLVLCGPSVGISVAESLEKGLRSDLQESRAVVTRAGGKLHVGGSPAAEVACLKSIAEKVRASHLLISERLRQRSERVSSIGGKAADRHNEVAAAYADAVDEYLGLTDALPSDGSIPPATLEALRKLADKIAPPRKRPLLGTLPYKHLSYPPREPASSPVVVPAYRGGDRSVNPADTAASAEAPISGDISSLAKSLEWNPVLIYEWVKNNVETEWYWGVMKGAEESEAPVT